MKLRPQFVDFWFFIRFFTCTPAVQAGRYYVMYICSKELDKHACMMAATVQGRIQRLKKGPGHKNKVGIAVANFYFYFLFFLFCHKGVSAVTNKSAPPFQ